MPSPVAAAEKAALDQGEALRISQAAVGKTIGDYTLLDRAGRPVELSSYRGKPLLVSFIYTGCFQACPTTTRTLDRAVANAQQVLGEDGFNIVSIGFNQPFDSPEALASYARQNQIHRAHWEFLSPPPALVADLARDFGFSYVATSAGFDHVTQLTVVDTEGRIYRQLYGENIPITALVEPLKQIITGTPVASNSRFDDLFNRVKLLCTIYDPASGAYRINYSIFLEIGGGLTFFGFMAWWLLRERRARRDTHLLT